MSPLSCNTTSRYPLAASLDAELCYVQSFSYGLEMDLLITSKTGRVFYKSAANLPMMSNSLINLRTQAAYMPAITLAALPDGSDILAEYRA